MLVIFIFHFFNSQGKDVVLVVISLIFNDFKDIALYKPFLNKNDQICL